MHDVGIFFLKCGKQVKKIFRSGPTSLFSLQNSTICVIRHFHVNLLEIELPTIFTVKKLSLMKCVFSKPVVGYNRAEPI